MLQDQRDDQSMVFYSFQGEQCIHECMTGQRGQCIHECMTGQRDQCIHECMTGQRDAWTRMVTCLDVAKT